MSTFPGYWQRSAALHFRIDGHGRVARRARRPQSRFPTNITSFGAGKGGKRHTENFKWQMANGKVQMERETICHLPIAISFFSFAFSPFSFCPLAPSPSVCPLRPDSDSH